MTSGTCGPVTLLVMAKAPVPGRVKTRLAATIGHGEAARVAAAALLDTLEACAAAVGPRRCRLALDGDLAAATGADDIRSALAGWDVVPQGAGTLAERIAAGCAGVDTPVVQIGMDTPQVTAGLLRAVGATLLEHDAVLGPAEDGGWWVLGLREPAGAAVVADVAMSTPDTGALTRQALVAAGLDVTTAPTLRDIDHLADLQAVAALAPYTRTAALAAEVTP